MKSYKPDLDGGSKQLDKVTTDKQKGIMKKLGAWKMVKLQKLGIKLYNKLCVHCKEQAHLDPYNPVLCKECELNCEEELEEMRKLALEASK